MEYLIFAFFALVDFTLGTEYDDGTDTGNSADCNITEACVLSVSNVTTLHQVNKKDFETWLCLPAGGRASDKSAKQHCKQVQTVLRNTYKAMSSLWNKVQLRRLLHTYAANKKHLPGTV